MVIQNGADGADYSAKVDHEGKLHTFALTESSDKHANRDEGKSWSLSFAGLTPVATTDYFFYLKNTGENNINITDIRISSTTVVSVGYHKVSGTPAFTGSLSTAITNRNFGSSKTPTITVQHDTDITGLTDEGKLFFEKLDTVNKLYHLRTTSNIIIPQGTAFGMIVTGTPGAIDCVVSIVEEENR